MKKNFSILIILLSTILCVGCWDHVEVDDIAIVSGIALDKTKEDKILVTMAIPTLKASDNSNYSRSSELQKQVMIVSAEGDSILSAYDEIQKKLARKIFLSEVEGIIIGEDLAKEGVAGILDFFSRNIESNPKIIMFFTKRKAAEIFNIISIQEINSIAELNKKTKTLECLNINFIDFLNALTEKGIEATADQIIKIPLDENKENSYKDMSATINGTAIFKEDKLIGWLSDKDTQGLLWIRGETQAETLILDIYEKKTSHISARTVKESAKIIPVINDKEISILVKINTELSVYENSSELNLGDYKNIDYIENKFAEVIEEKIESVIQKAQKEFNSDILGFGKRVYEKYPSQWNNYYSKDWETIFPNIEINIVCDVNVARIGNDTITLTKPDE